MVQPLNIGVRDILSKEADLILRLTKALRRRVSSEKTWLHRAFLENADYIKATETL